MDRTSIGKIDLHHGAPRNQGKGNAPNSNQEQYCHTSFVSRRHIQPPDDQLRNGQYSEVGDKIEHRRNYIQNVYVDRAVTPFIEDVPNFPSRRAAKCPQEGRRNGIDHVYSHQDMNCPEHSVAVPQRIEEV